MRLVLAPGRRLLVFFALAFALLAGQHASSLHSLAHAAEQVRQKQDSKPATPSCEQCSLFSQLAGAVTAAVPDVPLHAGGECPFTFSERCGGGATRLAYRSRAPPAA